MRLYIESLLLSLLVAVPLAAGGTSDQAPARSVIDDQRSAATVLSVLDADTMPSPGIPIGITSHDLQHNYTQGHQVARRPGAETVHFAWTMMSYVPGDIDPLFRYVSYNSWDVPSASLNQGPLGDSVSLAPFARAGYVRIDVDGSNLCHLTMHQRIEQIFPYSVWHLYFPIEGSRLHLDYELPKPGLYPNEIESVWPDIAVERNHGLKENTTDIIHLLSTGTEDVGSTPYHSDHLWYWRFDRGAPLPVWEGPVLIDSSQTLSYVIAADENSNRVAIAFTSDYSTDNLNGVDNVVYRESQTSGVGWLTGTELGPPNKLFVTVYDDPAGPCAWPNLSIAYDHQSTLHVVWTEQRAPGSEDMAIRHWSTAQPTTSTVTVGYYPNTNTWLRQLNLSQVTLGIGDGATPCNGGVTTNEDYLYVLYMKLGGETPEEQADISQLGRANGELYLTVSPNGGANWSPPVNLTNTRTPNCSGLSPDAPCASESWATIARDVSNIEILYIRDYEPGDFGESIWTLNKVMYLSIPGGTTDAKHLCPYFPCDCPCLGDPACDGLTNVLDVVHAVDVAFRSATAVFDYSCPYAQTDVDCSDATDVLDVVHFVNVAFRGGDPETEFCDPCAE